MSALVVRPATASDAGPLLRAGCAGVSSRPALDELLAAPRRPYAEERGASGARAAQSERSGDLVAVAPDGVFTLAACERAGAYLGGGEQRPATPTFQALGRSWRAAPDEEFAPLAEQTTDGPCPRRVA